MAVKKGAEPIALVDQFGEVVGEAAQVAPALIDSTGSAVMKESVASASREAMAAAAAGVEKGNKEVKASMDKAIKTAEEFVSFGQGNVEALLKSGQIWVAGVQDLGKHLAASAQAHFDETVSTFKALSSVKSLKEAIDLQSKLAQTSVEKAVAETGKLTDASLKLAEQTLAPITARVTLAVEKFGRSV